MKTIFRQIAPYAAAIIIFMAISVGYFLPVIFEEKTLYQTDIRKGAGMGPDLGAHQKETGEKSLWASRMFSGMPAYQIAPGYKANPVLNKLRRAFEGWLPVPANYLFGYMLGFFILLCALRINPWLSIIGAIAYAFSSYFLIIIGAGHIWKVFVLELIPPTLAGIVWAYRGKYFAGAAVTALFLALQLVSNHIQMTYYSLLFVGVFLVCRFINDFRNKQLPQFAKATLAIVAASLLAFGANATSMMLSSKYASQTIRGKSELTSNSDNKTSGLDRSYATDWSYGIGETFTLLIPDTKGGATGYMQENHPEEVKSAANEPNIRQFIGSLNSYWGGQPFTSGPVYVGAFILFLFIFGLFVIKGYLKWALAIGTAFSILLSWGNNFMWFTNLFLDYFPMYNKFRAVSSILVVAEWCIPMLAMLALAKIFEQSKLLVEKRKELLISLGLTAGIAFVFIVMPRVFFDFTSNSEVKEFAPYYKDAAYAKAFGQLEDARVAAFRADAWRSIFIILIGVGLLLLFGYKKIKPALFIAGVAVLTLFDLASVNKRYLNNGNFVPKAKATVAWEMTEADKIILEDKDPNYRVFNLAVSPFNDASTSLYHKSVGGYHAAKLRRYQELIEQHLSKMNMDVLNMLNTRYLIIAAKDGSPTVQRNPDALGPVWFVDSLRIVNNADEEIAALDHFNPRATAVVDKKFDKLLQDFVPQSDPTAHIELTDYQINHLTYKTNSDSEQLAVFSEVYYDDGLTNWDAFIDGQPVPHLRVNYVLRALRIPAGEHTVEFVFKPTVYRTLESISMICIYLLLASLAAVIALAIMQKRKQLHLSAK